MEESRKSSFVDKLKDKLVGILSYNKSLGIL